MNTRGQGNAISCEAVVGFIEGKVTVQDIPEEIISDISVSIRKGSESYAQASRYMKVDEPFHFIVEPGSYVLECSLDQVKLRSGEFTVGPGQRRVVHFHFRNDAQADGR